MKTTYLGIRGVRVRVVVGGGLQCIFMHESYMAAEPFLHSAHSDVTL
jgi:hypothetical protein